MTPFHPSSVINSPSLSQGLEAFQLSATVAGRSRQTLELYQRSVEPLIQFLGDPELGQITPGDLRGYLAHLQEHLNPVTVSIRWRSIKACFNWLENEGWLKDNPIKHIATPHLPKQYPYVLSDPQVQALLRAAKKRTANWYSFRDYTVILTFLDCGLRVSELIHLTLTDLNALRHSLRVIGKGSKEREVFFGQRLARVMREWLSRRTLNLPGDTLFSTRQGYPLRRYNIVRMLHQLGRQAGISGVRLSPHTLRHTFATQFIRNGGDPFALQRLLGHADIQTTMIYVHMAGAALREAHARASPVDRLLS